jgi:long-chain fatty acid transport protein
LDERGASVVPTDPNKRVDARRGGAPLAWEAIMATVVVRRVSARTTPILGIGAISLLAAADARAAGFGLDVQSGRGTGMAGSVTGFIDDSSAIFYNPAGIAQGRSIDAQVGDTLIMPTYTFTPPRGASTSTPFKVVPPFQAFVSGGITDHLSVGLGVFTPYGLVVGWPKDWAGNVLITDVSLVTYDIDPTVAYRIGPVRIGGGVQVDAASLDLKRKIAIGTQLASTELSAGAWGVGGNVGVQVEAIKKYLLLGVHYRSQVTLDFSDGKATFSDVPAVAAPVLHDQKASTSITLPNSVAMAVASHPISDLVVDAEVVWTNWNKLQSVDIAFPDDRSGMLSMSQKKNWGDVVNVHVGGEYMIDDTWAVRGGLLYDPTPAPAETLTPELPDADRLNMAVGGSYYHPIGLRFDLGYQLVVLFKRTSTATQLPGDYNGLANVVGLSIGYHFPP